MNAAVKNVENDIDIEIEKKVTEFERDMKENKVTWHSVDEMNAFIDGVIAKNV